MIEINGFELQVFMTKFLLILFRISAMVMTLPVIGTKLVPPRIRIILSAFVSFLIFPNVEPYYIELFSLQGIIIIAQQILIGITIGFSMQLIFHVFILLGEMVAMQSGLGFAVLNDPNSATSVPMISQVYLMVATLLFLVMDGHLQIFRMMALSFDQIPIYSGIAAIQFEQIALIGSWMFQQAFNIALPAITALLMVNIAFGVMTRAAPQLNIFSIGFPITMVLGIIILWLNLGVVAPHFVKIMDNGFGFIENRIAQ